MGITREKRANILMWGGIMMVVLGAFVGFLTDFDGILLIVGGLLLYEVVVRSEPGQQVFPKPSSMLPENKFLRWMFVLSGVLLSAKSVLDLWKIYL